MNVWQILTSYNSLSHHGTDSMRDLGLLCLNKMLRPVGITFSGTRNVFLTSVIPVTFGPAWPWFRTAR